MPQTIDRKAANSSKTKRRWFVPGLIGFFLVVLVIIVAAIIIVNRRQPIVAKKLPPGVLEKQKGNPASILEESNIYKAKIPISATNPTASPTKTANLLKNKIKSASPAGNKKESQPGKILFPYLKKTHHQGYKYNDTRGNDSAD